MDPYYVLFVLLPLFGLVVCGVTAWLASRKGYSAILWFLAGGIVGLLVLAFLPFVNRSDPLDGTSSDLRRRGNSLGAMLSVVTLGLWWVLRPPRGWW